MERRKAKTKQKTKKDTWRKGVKQKKNRKQT